MTLIAASVIAVGISVGWYNLRDGGVTKSVVGHFGKQTIIEVKLPKNFDPHSLKTGHSEAKCGYEGTLSGVRTSDMSIVVGHATQDFLNRSHRYTTLPQDSDVLDRDTNTYVDDAWTEGTFVVDRVLYARPGDAITAGSTITFAEHVGIVTDHGAAVKTVMESSNELAKDSQYVVFFDRHGDDGVYWLTNLNLGHFNTDGTDPQDEIGGGIRGSGSHSAKQKLRDELAAQYPSVTFNFLPQVTITQTTLIPPINRPCPPPGPCPPSKPATSIAYTLADNPPANSTVNVEQQQSDGTWKVVGQKYADGTAGSMNVPQLAAASVLRIRLTNGNRTSNYSSTYTTP